MTPESARDKKYWGVKMQTVRVVSCSGIPQSTKGHQKSKIGVNFAKCAPMTHAPLYPLVKAGE